MRTNQQHHQQHFLKGIPGTQSHCSGYFVLAPYCRSYLCYLEQIPDGFVWAAGQWEPRGHLALREAPLDGFQTRPDTPVSAGSPTPTHIQSQCHSLKSLRLWSRNKNQSRKQVIFVLLLVMKITGFGQAKVPSGWGEHQGCPAGK